jgi:hypothetical protein
MTELVCNMAKRARYGRTAVGGNGPSIKRRMTGTAKVTIENAKA